MKDNDMKKKEYSKPQMEIVKLDCQQSLLSYSGFANSPEATFGVDNMNIFGADDAVNFSSDEVTFSDGGDLVHFSD